MAASGDRVTFGVPSTVRTVVIVDGHEPGQTSRFARAADRRLRPLLDRELVGFQQGGAGFGSWLEPPRPAATLIVDLEGELRADGVALPGAWFGGLSDRYTVVEFGDRYTSLDVKLSPLGAYRVLGRPLGELARQIVSLEDLFGGDGRRLADQLRATADWARRFDLVERFLLERAAAGPVPSPGVAWAWDCLRASAGRARVETLARELRCSRRYLATRFLEEVGLPPKKVARLLRFQHVRDRLEHAPASLADIAYESGYSDQSHLNRDFRELAGTTPTEFLARQIPGGGVVGDEIPFVQD